MTNQPNARANYDDAAIDRLFNATVSGDNGEKIGKVGQVYLNDASGQPEWVTVQTGLFGAKETFVPLRHAQISGEDIRVPYTKEFVKDAPSIDPDKHIDENEQQALYRYYEDFHRGRGEQFADNAGTADANRTADANVDANRTADVNRDKVAGNDNEMIAHEERLHVGTQQEEAGRVRLRKRVVTEQQQVTVPVQHEELVVDRQPIAEGERVNDNARIGEQTQEQDIVLHAEKPVVTTETVATERVNVGKKTVTENETVQGQVRKEQIEVEGQNVRDAGTRTADEKLNDGKFNK